MKSKILQWIGPVSVVAGVTLYAAVKLFRPEFMTIIFCLVLAFFAWAGVTVWLRDRRDQARMTMEADHNNENDSKEDHSA